MAEREKEVDAAKQAARTALEGTPPIVVDLLEGQLKTSKAIYDESGQRVVWENGAHGMYGMQGPDWCYMDRCSAPKAVQFAIMSQKQSVAAGDESAKLMARFSGNVDQLLGFNDVETAADGFQWDSEFGNRWQDTGDGKGVVWNGSEKLFLTQVTVLEGNKAFAYSAKAIGKGDTVYSETMVPRRWGLTPRDVTLWACRAGLNGVQANMRKGK